MTCLRVRAALTATVLVLALLPTIDAQNNQPPLNSYRLTGPTTVAVSTPNSSGVFPVTFKSATVALSCPASPIVTLSSTADGTGKVFVDNFVDLTVGESTQNICNVANAAFDSSPSPGFHDCFQDPWHSSAGNYVGQNPDTLAEMFGVGPIGLNGFFAPNATTTARFDDIDFGGFVAGSSLYLATNCTVTGGSVTNNTPITGSSGQIQSFSFNNGQQVFTGNWSQQGVDTSENAVPSVANQGISPANWPGYVAGTSFATTQCIPHSGEVDPFGNVLCKAYTLTCVNNISNTPSGSNCPQSSVRDILFTDAFSVPSADQGLLQIPTATNSLGFGLLMGSDNWSAGNCVFTPGSADAGLLCPQNLATTFHDIRSGGTTKGTNSTFVVVTGVPLPVTTVNGVGNGGTITVTTPNPTLTFVTNPPTASGNGFTAAPIESVTFGIDSGAPYPDTTFPIPGDQQATPTVTPSCTGPATTFTATAQPTLTVGTHTLHFFATDCAATEELVYDTSNLLNKNNWTSFKTVTINVGQFGGFLAPVSNPPNVNVVKAGNAVPVKFSLGGNFGLNIFAAGYPRLQGTPCTTAPKDLITETVTAGNSSLQYDATSNTYVYVWKTSSAWSGTCGKLVLTFADGKTTDYALFRFN